MLLKRQQAHKAKKEFSIPSAEREWDMQSEAALFVILEHLTKKYDVYIFSSERAYEFLASKFDNVFEIGGFNTVYENNVVRTKKTFFKALKANPTNLKEGYN